MYCLEKFQRELAYFLDIDLRDLPKVQEILQSQGYTAVKKNDEIIELGNGKVSKEQVEKLKEVVEKPTPKVDNAEVLQINADEAITKLHSTQGQPIPQEIDIQTFKNVLESIENQDNFITHLQKKQDAQSRLAYLNLVEPTLKEWDIKLTKGDRKELIKVFNDGDNFFTLLITEQDNKRLITFIPKARDGYIESKIKNADLIQTFASRASESKAEWTRVANSTTNNLKWQQDGNVLRSVVELENGEKLLLSKDRLENVYIQSNHIEQVNSYDELILQESLEKFAKDELENKLAKQIESKGDSVIFQRNSVLSVSEKSHSNISRDTSPMAQYDKVDSSKQIESQAISQFGENYPQFYHKAHEAIQHLLHTKSGQVQGAFYRKELGDIDLVWGNEKIGLQKIVDKHLKDFANFAGNNPYEKMSNAINEIVENGKLLTENGVNTLYLQKDNKTFLVGLSKGWHNKGDNQWIITSYEAKNLKADMLEKIGANKTISADESLNALQTFNATDKDIIPQKKNKAGIARLDSTQIQSQMQKEQEAQQKMAEHFANTQAKRDEIIAQKEARLGKNADEVPLDKGQDILYKPIRDTSIVLNDETAPFEAEFVIVKLSDIKPNFDNTNTQGRLIKQENVIENIINDFKPELIFYQEGGVNGVPIITRDGKVVAGNHRSEALKQIFNAQTHNAETAREAYKKNAKDFLGVDLENDEIIVRRLKEHISDKEILQLAFSSNIGRESTMGEKALSTLSLYRQNIATLPKALSSENVNELKSIVAKHLDKQGNGLNTFEPNLALLTSLARNGKNSNILQSLDAIKGSSEYKNKIINMYVDNAGSFYNLAHNPSFKNLEFRDILSDAIYYTANQNPTREVDYTHLINDIESFLNLAKDKQALEQALILDSNKVQNLTAQAFGLALAKFSRQENPSSALYECLKEAPKALEEASQPTFFTEGKALSEIDVYDFLEYLINQGQVTQSQSNLSSLMPRLREIKESLDTPQANTLKVESNTQIDKDISPTAQYDKGADSTLNAEKQIESSLESTPQKADSSLSQEIKDIIDSSPAKGRDMQIIGEANFTPQVVEYAHKNNKKVAIDKLSQAEAEQLGYKYPNDVRVTIDYSAINHTLNRHGAESALVKNSGQKAVDYTDIAEYRSIVKGADETLFSRDDLGQDVVLSFKQINGYAVVVESIRKKGNELAFKSMYFENGSYKNSNAYKNAVDSQKANHSPAPYGYEPHADDSTPPLKTDTAIIPQQTLESTMQKFNYDEKKAKDLLEWHKDSSPLTKDENGLPKVENMLESKVKAQGQDLDIKDNVKTLENVFLDSNGKVDLSRIKATALPKVAFNNTKQFKNLFENKQGKYGIVKTPYKDVKINIGYAYKHFYQNTHNANRDYIKGAFFDVLQKPMFVIEQENERGLITYFYKVYKYENGNIGIFGIGVDSGGHIDYRTMYKDDNNQRLNQLLKLDSKKVVYMDNEWLP